MSDNNDKILAKIRNLLELAQDGGDDEESQTALLMAQKLMLKHKISQHEIEDIGVDAIMTKSLSIYKAIYWWEKVLVEIIADNFRIMYYLQSSRFPHQQRVQRKIVLMGYNEDVELAYHVYHLAVETMKYHATQHLQLYKLDKQTSGALGEERRAYYQGFLDGLAARFKAQRQAMTSENEQYALIIKVPTEVKQAFDQVVNGKIVFKQPASNMEALAYQAGFDKGKQVELRTKRLTK